MQARQLHIQGKTHDAIMLLTLAIQQDPSNTNIAMDMVQIFIDMGEIEQASSLFNRLPESVKASDTGLSLSGQLWIIEEAGKTAGLQALKETLMKNPDDYDARFDCAICEIAQHNPRQALDHLFYIQQNKADYKDGAAREMIITIINCSKRPGKCTEVQNTAGRHAGGIKAQNSSSREAHSNLYRERFSADHHGWWKCGKGRELLSAEHQPG